MAGYAKNKATVMPEISGQALQAARLKLKMKPEELGAKACLSKKHIIQLEEGGVSCFYSEAHKITVAKKVGKLLNLEESQFLVYSDGHQALQNSLPFDVEPEASNQALPGEPILGESEAIKNAPVRPAVAPVVSGNKEKIKLETPWLTKERLTQKLQFQLPANVLKWGLLLSVVAGLYITKDDVIELFNSNPPAPAIASPVEQDATEASASSLEGSSAAVTAANVAILNPPLPSEESCPKPDAGMVEYRVTEATKSADFVFVQSKAKQIICVVDASGKSNRQSLDTGASYTFVGKAPFTVLTNNLSQLSIYFQGRPVRIQGDKTRSIKLQEVKLSQ